MSLVNKLETFAVSGVLALGFGVEAKGQGLVAHWGFDEGSGSTVIDSTGNNYIGTLQGGVSWINNGISGSALHFDGGYVSFPVILEGLPEVTLEAWVKRDSHSDGMVVSRNGPFYLSVRGDEVEGGVYAGNGWTEIRGTTPLELNRWYKIAMSYDKSFARVYLNGLEDASVPKTGDIIVTGQGLNIGWGQPGHDQYFKGIIDEVSIYGSVVPEPSTYALFGLGIGALALAGLMRKKR